MRPPGFTYYALWNGVERMSKTFPVFTFVVVYHVAPLLNAEEQRRLIGNDIAVLFFLDDPDTSVKFSLSGLDTFGEVPQVFAVVQPIGTTGTFRCVFVLTAAANRSPRAGFCSKNNIEPHNPCTPAGVLNDRTTKAIVLTKCI